MTWLALAVGGALGSVARHGLNQLVHARLLSTAFPVGTLLVNLCGCLVIGLLAGLLAAGRMAFNPHWQAFVFVGLLGGFTTFSAFGLDTFVLARTQPSQAAVNVAVQVIGGLLAVWFGYQFGLSKG